MQLRNKLQIRELVLNKFDKKCSYCGAELNINNLQLDHFVPKRRNMTDTDHGSDSVENFMPSCTLCNSSKNSMSLEVWRKELEMKLKRLFRDSSTYRVALRFGLVQETNNPIIFHFEKHTDG